MKPITYLLLLAGGIGLSACGSNSTNQQQVPPPPTPVTTEKVAKGNATYFDEFPATIAPFREVEIQAQVAGNITGIFSGWATCA